MDSTEIYQEGLRLGPTKVVEGGRERRDIVDLLGRNSRFSYPAVGDLNAQIACARTGERAPLGAHRALRHRDARARPATRSSRRPSGSSGSRSARSPTASYEAEGALDNDGLSDTPVAVRVRIEISGGDMTIDLRGTDDAAAGPVNCGEAAGDLGLPRRLQAARRTRPADERRLVRAALGAGAGAARSSAPTEPSPCAWYFSPLGLLIDLVVKALSPVLPAEGGRRELRRLDDRDLRRPRPAHRRGLLPHRADGRRLGRLGGRPTARAA